MKNLKTKLLSILIPAFLICNTCNPLKKISSAPKNSLKYYKEVLNHFSEGIKEIKYASDYETYGKLYSYWQTPLETAKRDSGNCSDKAIFLNSLVKDKLDIQLIYGTYKKTDTTKHCWQQFNIGKDIYIVASSNELNIYKKDSLLKSNNNILYRPIVGNKPFQEKINAYEKRTGVHLDFKYYQ